MGVKGLWGTLNPIKEVIPVSSLRGKVLAVDLAIWIVQSEAVINGDVKYDGIYLRQMFYKVNHLLELGIGLVIVTDGRAPHLKAITIAKRLGFNLDRNTKVIQRRRFMRVMKECETLAKSLGLTVLKGAHEAEAAAAKLQQDGLVDGVITTDGDAFLYGARQVYRNLLVTEKECELYRMTRVETELGLSRDDLMGLAVLNGCDYSPGGVAGLGKPTILNFILSRDRSRGITDELVSWSNQREEIAAKYEQLKNIKSKTHCSVCKHEGTKKHHTLHGCHTCSTTTSCLSHSTPCTCAKHTAQRLLNMPHMMCCVKFVKHCNVNLIPVKDIVEEFSNIQKNEYVYPAWNQPTPFDFINFMFTHLQWRKPVTCEKLCHVMALHVISKGLQYDKPYPVLDNVSLKFSHIVKRRKKDKVDMLELEFSVIDPMIRELMELDVVYATIDEQFITYLLPGAVQEFNQRTKPLSKKKKEKIPPIYERYGIKSPSKPSETISRVKKSNKDKKNKKISSPEKIEIEKIALDLESMVISARDYRGPILLGRLSDSSEDDGYIPLSQRIAQRRARAQKAPPQTAPPQTPPPQTPPPQTPPLLTAVQTTSSLSSLEAEAKIEDRKEETTRDYDVTDTCDDVTDTIFDNDDVTGHVTPDDSEVQMLPLSFMDEYLDLSTDHRDSYLADKPNLGNEVSNLELDETPNLEDFDETPNLEDFVEIPNLEDFVETSNIEDFDEPPNLENFDEPPNLTNLKDFDETPNLEDYDNTPNLEDFVETSNLEHFVEPPNMEEFGETPNLEDFDETPNLEDFDETPNLDAEMSVNEAYEDQNNLDTISVEDDDNSQKINTPSEPDYHQIFFTTPHKNKVPPVSDSQLFDETPDFSDVIKPKSRDVTRPKSRDFSEKETSQDTERSDDITVQEPCTRADAPVKCDNKPDSSESSDVTSESSDVIKPKSRDTVSDLIKEILSDSLRELELELSFFSDNQSGDLFDRNETSLLSIDTSNVTSPLDMTSSQEQAENFEKSPKNLLEDPMDPPTLNKRSGFSSFNDSSILEIPHSLSSVLPSISPSSDVTEPRGDDVITPPANLARAHHPPDTSFITHSNIQIKSLTWEARKPLNPITASSTPKPNTKSLQLGPRPLPGIDSGDNFNLNITELLENE